MKRDEENEKAAHLRRMDHASDVRKQIKEKEQDRVTARKSFFEEGLRLDQEARDRREKLNQIKLRKLQELRDAGVPEKYCAEVSRRIYAPPATFSMS
jgi:Ni/Co efflux regulator RcnB